MLAYISFLWCGVVQLGVSYYYANFNISVFSEKILTIIELFYVFVYHELGLVFGLVVICDRLREKGPCVQKLIFSYGLQRHLRKTLAKLRFLAYNTC